MNTKFYSNVPKTDWTTFLMVKDVSNVFCDRWLTWKPDLHTHTHTLRSLTSGNSERKERKTSTIEEWSAPTQTRQCKRGSSSFVPAGRFTVYKHSAFTAECPNKKLFEDFAQSISRAVSIDLLHNDSPVIAWERALTGDWVARHIGMTKPSICF